jgi:hypothetical protein
MNKYFIAQNRSSVSENPHSIIRNGFLYNGYLILENDIVATPMVDWRIPTRNDYIDMYTHIATYDDYYFTSVTDNNISKALRQKSTEYWLVADGDNAVKFNLRGAGMRNVAGIFSAIRQWVFQSTITGEDGGYRLLKTEYNSYTLYDNVIAGLTFGASIRLVRNATVGEQLLADGTTMTPYEGTDEKVYRTVKIGDKVWLGENLAETKRSNGDWIQGFDMGVYTPILSSVWEQLDIGALCAYDDDMSNV